MWRLPDLTILFYLAVVGMIALALAGVSAVAAIIWFIMNHVRIV